MALSGVVGLVSRKISYTVVRVLIQQSFTRPPILVDSLSPVGAILRTHFRVVPIVRFTQSSRIRSDCTSPIIYTLYLHYGERVSDRPATSTSVE